MPENIIITPEALTEFGFHKIHMNPAWNGGYFRWIKEISEAKQINIAVTFGCHYCQCDQVPFLAWFYVGDFISTDKVLEHIKTVEQLHSLWLALSGEPLIIEEKIVGEQA